ncbi:MAG: helicase [Acidobacteria bacterium]|nr:helicase [Acidobacteriota bacterium]
MLLLPDQAPEVGDLVQVRSRRWLVEGVEETANPAESARVRLACVDDDNQGRALEVFWKYEPDRLIVKDAGWKDLGAKGLDPPRQFAAFLNTLRWSCTTATDPTLFQAPFRAGITIDSYQMEPLRKALLLPRVNLLIADDTGLGKTIEAGLITRELLLRRKVRVIVVAAPPSMLEQWKSEMEARFGLVFEVLDRSYVSRMRRERGFGVNPWRTHSRFLVSQRLLIDPAYTDPMREWLGTNRRGSLLILDEAHHAAPSSGGRYGIESKFTKSVRDLAHRFEHRLFLSATPHNGHSNSFSTLLELLDPYRFTRGVKITAPQTDLAPVMVRRLKEDIREMQGGFPRRNVRKIVLDDLPEDAPELELSRLLEEYRTAREGRYRSEPRRARSASGLLVIGLQQRLLSSIEAFHRTLKVHRKTVQRHWDQSQENRAEQTASSSDQMDGFVKAPDADDERADWNEQEEAADEEAQIKALNTIARPSADPELQAWQREQALLDRMERIAEESRHLPDAKTRWLIDWIRQNQCPELPAYGRSIVGSPPTWTDRRVLIFTENREGTKRYLRSTLEAAIAGSDQADDRIAVIDGLTSPARRRDVQRRFNADPTLEPLRILLATDAAREGLNLQARCSDMFHFDLPWNPSRIEQRNGRIDRKLQPAPEVNCHYFVLPQRTEDRVLEVLVRKTETIKKELGGLPKALDDSLEKRLSKHGIPHHQADRISREIESDSMEAGAAAIDEDLEAARERRHDLRTQVERCRDLLNKSRTWVKFSSESFRNAINCSLDLLGAPPLTESPTDNGHTEWAFPGLEHRAWADPSWVSTLDSLRVPRKIDQKVPDWRRDAPIRPVVFEDTGRLDDQVVHLHLEQRMAQRLLGRFRAQGFVYHDLSRACLVQSRDAIPRVVLLGRLSLYGRGAERLHEELVTVAARWSHPSHRDKSLQPYARDAQELTLGLLNEALSKTRGGSLSQEIRNRLAESAACDIEELRTPLESRADELAARAEQKLAERGIREERALHQTLERHRAQVIAQLEKYDQEYQQLSLGFNSAEVRQLNSDIRHWRRRLDQFDQDLAEEPARVREFYQVQAKRMEPVGLVYLWPETN